MNWVGARMLELGIDRTQLARRCGCTETLIEYAERGMPVHPAFADRIAKALRADRAQRDMIVLERHRLNAPPEPPEAAEPKQMNNSIRRGAPKRPIVEVTRDGQEIRRYEGLQHAARVIGISKTPLQNRCDRARLREGEFRAFGVTWRWADEWDGMTLAERLRDIGAGSEQQDGGRLKKRRAQRREDVVVIDPAGNEVRRCSGVSYAAKLAGTTKEAVMYRCRREIKKREFERYGVTWRYAVEWDNMSRADQLRDVGLPAPEGLRAAKAAPKPVEAPEAVRRGGWDRKPRAVVEIDRAGKTLKRYGSVAEVERAHGLGGICVINRCRRNYRKDEFRQCGVTWRYADEWDEMTQEERLRDVEKGS
jgi:transcriptional regulator with XRE-family HTH domain